MKTFKDNAGRSWSISVDIATIRRVRKVLGVNLVASDLADILKKILGDPVLLCDILYVVCKPEADKEGISDEDFGRAMAGDAIEHATVAFLEALADFTPNPRDRARVLRAIREILGLAERARDIVERKLDLQIAKASAEVLADLEAETSGPRSAASPASSGSAQPTSTP